jgi:hypothetical protein
MPFLLATDRGLKERVKDGVYAVRITWGRVGHAWENVCDERDATVERSGFL